MNTSNVDANAIKMRIAQQQDPVLTIDALVAELELNTDQVIICGIVVTLFRVILNFHTRYRYSHR